MKIMPTVTVPGGRYCMDHMVTCPYLQENGIHGDICSIFHSCVSTALTQTRESGRLVVRLGKPQKCRGCREARVVG